MIFLITGPDKSGKTYLADKMKNAGWTVTNQSTDDINNIDAIIIDPDDINKTTDLFPEKLFCMIKINTDPTMRKIYALRNIDKEHKIEAEEKFDNENNKTVEKFAALDDATEAFRQNLNVFSNNMSNIIEYQNDYSEKSADDLIDFLKNYKTANEKMTGVVKDAIKLNLFTQNKDHPDKIELQDNDGTKLTSPEVLAGILVGNPHEFWSFMMNYICKSERFSDI